MTSLPLLRSPFAKVTNPERSSFTNKTPVLPLRPEKTSLFLSESHRTKPMLSTLLNGNNENPLTIGMRTPKLQLSISVKNMQSEISRDNAIERFQTQKCPQKSMDGSQYQGAHNPCL